MHIHVQLQTPNCARTNKYLIADLTSWHNSIFGFKLRTIEAENPLKVENSEPQLRIYWFL